MIVEFWLGGARRITHDVPPEKIQECLDLPKTKDRFAYWREVTGDPRIEGNVLVWQPKGEANGSETKI